MRPCKPLANAFVGEVVSDVVAWGLRNGQWNVEWSWGSSKKRHQTIREHDGSKRTTRGLQKAQCRASRCPWKRKSDSGHIGHDNFGVMWADIQCKCTFVQCNNQVMRGTSGKSANWVSLLWLYARNTFGTGNEDIRGQTEERGSVSLST